MLLLIYSRYIAFLLNELDFYFELRKRGTLGYKTSIKGTLSFFLKQLCEFWCCLLCGYLFSGRPCKFGPRKDATRDEMDGLHTGGNTYRSCSVKKLRHIWRSDLDTLLSFSKYRKYNYLVLVNVLSLYVTEQGSFGWFIWENIVREAWIWTTGELYSMIT